MEFSLALLLTLFAARLSSRGCRARWEFAGFVSVRSPGRRANRRTAQVRQSRPGSGRRDPDHRISHVRLGAGSSSRRTHHDAGIDRSMGQRVYRYPAVRRRFLERRLQPVLQQRVKDALYNGGDTPEKDAQVSITWLKAFGTGAIAVSGPKSQEFWKAFAHPAKFDGRLPLLWSEDDVNIYRVPRRTESLAHVVPESALVRRAPSGPGDTEEVEKYVAALDGCRCRRRSSSGKAKIGFTSAQRHGRGQVVSVCSGHAPSRMACEGQWRLAADIRAAMGSD